MRTERSEVLRFGTFEVDLRARELRKQGKRIKVQEQPFHVLTVLLQRPGEVVTREELRNQNWPPDTFVDFDNSLNTAINKLREALGDSADNPRFIETLPRRGYRFLVPVSGEQRRKSRGLASRWVLGTGVGIVVLVVAVASGLLWRSHRLRVLSEKDTIVLGDFANSTGDPVFDGTLREGLSVQLEQSPFLSLVSEEGIHQTLRMMERPANTQLTPEITREVCQRTRSAAALDGSIALIGTRYDLILKAVDCASGNLLASTESQANDKSHVLDALSNVASEMRRKLGESLTTVQKYSTPLAQATTPSLEALQAFTLATKGGITEQLPLLQRATQLDPNFAVAYMILSDSYDFLGESALAAENARKAYEMRAGVSEHERLQIEEHYYFYGTGNLFMAQRADELGVRTYPRDPGFHSNLGDDLRLLGQYEAGLKEHLQAVSLAPPRSLFYRQVVYAYLLLNQVEEAEAAAKEAHAKGVDSDLPAVLYGIAFYRGDTAEMARQVANSANNPFYKRFLVALEADTAAYFGHLGRARDFSRHAVDSAERTGDHGTATEYSAVSALREALFGDAGAAREQAAVVEKHASGRRDAIYAGALALAYAGDTKQTQALVDKLAKRYPEDTNMQVNCLPTLRAKLALAHANPQEALDILRVAGPYELGLPSFTFYNWPNMYPVYVRGEAYLAARQGREAAAEFQKILDHRGIVLNEPIGALAHLQLGHAYSLQGDSGKAKAAYQDFLALWKDADPDIPIFKEAKAEYAKLQ
jgi:eukaryotic-like serine/threonine-protein kinase